MLQPARYNWHPSLSTDLEISEESSTLDVQRYMVQSVPSGERSAAIFEEGEADEVVARNRESGLVVWVDADDAALTVKAGCDVQVVVHVERDALSPAQALIKDGRVAVAVDGVDGLV